MAKIWRGPLSAFTTCKQLRTFLIIRISRDQKCNWVGGDHPCLQKESLPHSDHAQLVQSPIIYYNFPHISVVVQFVIMLPLLQPKPSSRSVALPWQLSVVVYLREVGHQINKLCFLVWESYV